MDPSQRFEARMILELERSLPVSYDLDRNLALLKLFLVYPSRRSEITVQKILSSALVQLPKVDFHLCLFLIPHQYTPQIKGFIDAAALLETGAFKQFWQELEKTQILDDDEKDKVRVFVGDIIGQTFSVIGLQQLGELLEYDLNTVTLFAKKKGWTVTDKIVFITPAAPTNVRAVY